MKKLSPGQWQIVEDYFHQAIELTPDDQQNLFAKVKSVHPELMAEVQQLVQSHKTSGAFLSGTVMDNIIVQAGENVGPWKVLREIGRGGMSTVYLAERDDGNFKRNVAIKFLHGLSPGHEMITRLRSEQTILAKLDHKYICKLLDAGIKDAGRPYFIMEYIDGETIDVYCNKYDLNLDERLELFLQVCEAVQYAHQRLIVHRDIKPSNIIVDRDGNAKLLDFGIAKLVEEDPELDITDTKTGLFLMTPEFASPEQIEQQTITTATDVYALGLLLCKLLTGSLPYEVTSKTPLEIGRTITETEPEKPSTLVAGKSDDSAFNSKSKSVSPNSKLIRKKLKGDLDNIILKALRKEPSRRYESAGQMLQDIKNYQTHLPVLARPESAVYRAKKFVMRHRTAVVSVALILITLIVSTAISLKQAQIANEQRGIAEERFEDVRKLAGSLLFEFHDAIADLPGSTPARSLIVERALEYLDGLTAIDNGNTDLQIELAAAYRVVGDVQGNPTNANLGRHEDAMNSYNKALELIEHVLETEPDRFDARRIHANIFEKMGDVQAANGQLESAELSKRQSTRLYLELAEEFTDEPARLREYAVSLIKLADLLGNPNFSHRNQPEEALENYLIAENILGFLHESSSIEDPDAVRLAGLVHERLGNMYDAEQNFPLALTHFEKSGEFRKQFVELQPFNANAIRDEAISYENLGQVFIKTNHLEQAKDNIEKANEIFKWLAETDPNNIQAQQTLAISYLHLGDLFFHSERNSFRDISAAKSHFDSSIKLLTNAFNVDSTNSRTAFLLDLVNRRIQNLPVNYNQTDG